MITLKNLHLLYHIDIRHLIYKIVKEVCYKRYYIMKKPNGYWNYDRCKDEALKYNRRIDFKNNSMSAYVKSSKEKWLDIICSHMKREVKKYWDKDKCIEEALKYKTKKDFYNFSLNVYKRCLRNKWLDEMCSHMMICGNRYKRCIYVWEFEDKSAYIGLTYNLNNRIRRHMVEKTSSVYKHLKKFKGDCKQLTDYIDIEKAQNEEIYYIRFYKNNNWNVLNISKGGGLGTFESDLTKQECENIALKYISKYDFRKNEKKVYNLICRKNWLDEVCKHMINRKNRSSYWTYDKCENEAIKYNSRTEFSNNCSPAYKNSFKNDWIGDWFDDKRIKK